MMELMRSLFLVWLKSTGRMSYINHSGRVVNWEVGMLKSVVPVVLSVLMIAGTASAGQVVSVSAASGSAGLDAFGSATRNFSPIVRQASYCRADCEACRSACYNTYRVNCYADHCRQSFTLCMRDCWYNICRQC